MKKFFKFIAYGLLLFVILIAVLTVYVYFETKIEYPTIDKSIENVKREKISKNHYRIGNNWLKLNEFGIWEMYIEGSPYERGFIYGKLSEELVQKHEDYFIAQIDKLIPSRFYFHFLRVMIAWFNKDIDEHITEEYLTEIYGVSKSFSNEYDILGNKYLRILNYHAAHDIGHALAEYAMVGCTSFSVNKSFSEDSSLLLARNFDFYMGDDFAKNKMVTFVNPDEGHQFMMYSWAGLMGVVSGMNEKGLTVTLNASKSDLPTESKTPISILAREIVQYASTIEEAVVIANKRETFVSESLLIGSAIDNKAVIIEKTPNGQDVFVSEVDYFVCSNHYQSNEFKNSEINIKNIKNSDSENRRLRTNELLDNKFPIDIQDAVSILRNQKDIGDKDVGLGNPKTINQLIAHHAVVFKPQDKLVWVSTPPYQLGSFIAYNVKNIHPYSDSSNVFIDSLTILKDTFVDSEIFLNYAKFKELKLKVFDYVLLNKELEISSLELERFISFNPKSYIAYLTIGDYFMKKEDYEKAKKYYKLALNHNVASLQESFSIEQKIEECTK